MSWFQIWTVCWQVSVFLTPIIVGAVFLWLNSKFVTKAEALVEKNRVDAALSTVRQDARTEANRVDAELSSQKSERDSRWERIKDKVAEHEGRLTAVEKDLSRPPSRHQLNNSLAVLQGGVHAVEVSVAGLKSQMETQSQDMRRHMETQNQYLQALLEKHLKA